MSEILLGIIPYLGGAIGAVIAFVLLREAVRSFQRYQWNKKKRRCLSLVGRLEYLKPEEVLSLATELKKSFSLEMVESVLGEEERLNQETRQKLASIFDHLGIVERHLTTLREAKSWQERANAAEKLGKIGHHRAVLPLMVVLQDAGEDREVQSVAIRALGKIRDERAIPPLIEALGQTDRTVGQALADVLVQFGSLVVEPLIKTLVSSNLEGQRLWAAQILGRLKNGKAVLPLSATLKDHVSSVRAEAARALGALQAHEAVHPLTEMILTDPEGLAREAAAEALGSIADERSLLPLQKTLADLDPEAKRLALQAIEKMGEKGRPFLLEALMESSPEARSQAAAALERSGLVAQKIDALEKESWEEAFIFLSKIAEAGVAETLIRSFNHASLIVRVRLCRILGSAKNLRGREALTNLARTDTEWAGRLEAMKALIHLAHPTSVDLLRKAIATEEAVVRENLLLGLQQAPRSFLEQFSDDIKRLLQDTNIKIRIEAVRLLAQLPGDCHIPDLIQTLSDAVAPVRQEAAKALGTIGHKESFDKAQDRKRLEVTEALVGALKDLDKAVRMAAIQSLGNLKNPEAIEPLARCFEWAEENQRDEISQALSGMPRQNMEAFADVLMGFPSAKARAGVVWTFGLIGDAKELKLMTSFLKDPDPIVRAAASGALGKLPAPPVPSLLPLLQDPNERVRAAAVNALGRSQEEAVVGQLIPLLESDPDTFVCQRVVLAVGCLTTHFSAKSQSALQSWLMKQKEDHGPAVAGLIALALIGDESSLKDILLAMQNSLLRGPMRKFLKELPLTAQERFFAHLSLDPGLFWRDKLDESRAHYAGLLRSGRNPEDRSRAIKALSILGGEEQLPSIEMAFTKDPDAQVRGNALTALGSLVKGKSLVAKVVMATRDPSDQVRSQVIPILSRLSPRELDDAREALIPLLDSQQESIRKPVTQLLSRLYAKDWHRLADELLGTDKQSRIIGLLETVAQMGDSQAASLFVQFLKHKDPLIRAKSAQAAAQTSLLSKQDWVPYLEDPLEPVRLAVIQGLGKQLDSEVLEIFAGHLEDPSTQIRREIATLLGEKKLAGDERPKEILRRLSRDEHLAVRLVSFVSLFRLGVTGLAKEVTAVMPNFEKEEHAAVLEYLKKEGIFIELVGTIQHARQAASRKEAIELLAALDLHSFAKEIVVSLQDPSSEVRLAAVEALGSLEAPDIQSALEALALDPVEAVRTAVKRRRMRTVK